MNTFVDNINLYLRERKIRNNYVSLVTGWSTSKVSRILSGVSSISDSDKEVLANSLGFNVDYFMKDMADKLYQPSIENKVALFAGDLCDDDRKTASNLIDMFRFYDSIVNMQI